MSLFEEHTSIIRRGKAGKETEYYGHKVWLEETEGGIISGYRVLEGNPADQDRLLLPALEHHEKRFGKPPGLVAADRGVYSPDNERECRKRGIERVCLCPSPARRRRANGGKSTRGRGGLDEGCATGRGSKAGSASLKRRGHLGKSRDKGEAGFGRWVGWGVLSSNLYTIARAVAAR